MKTVNTCKGCDCETPCTPFETQAQYEAYDSELTGKRFIGIIANGNKTKCRNCGGKGKSSKGIVNTHHIQKSYLRGETEFTTDIVDCLKCEDCGHSWN
jgi:hypothetical protein